MKVIVLVGTIMLGLLIGTNVSGTNAMNDDLAQRRKTLNDLLAEQWVYTLEHNPEFASILGDRRWNDKLSDVSQVAVDADLAKTKEFLTRFEAIDTKGFPEQEALNKRLMVRGLKENLDNAKFKNWEMPVNQISGIHIDAPQFVPLLPFETIKDYEDFIARMKQFPKVLDDTMAMMRRGLADGLMPPKFLLEKVVSQAADIADDDPEKSPFASPLQNFSKKLTDAEKNKIHDSLISAIRDGVLPAYAKFAKFVKDEYAPKGRTEFGIWSLPLGAERYRAAIKSQTTTAMAPEQIHQIGLHEVARIEKEMLLIANKQGFKDLKSFNAAIEKDPKLRPQSRGQILEMYRKFTDQMRLQLRKLFGRLPKADVVVDKIEEFNEKDASTHYDQGAPDGSRPGRIMVNTGDYQNRKTISFESTAYHEGLPGHHLQVSIAQELSELPPFRQQAGYTAYVEGWALYSERLGKEVGFYQDPYSRYGALQDEMLRAIRLVVDTGFHYNQWTRDQVVKFFHDHSAIDEPDVQSETDRYISWPGQALAYKIGQLKILELRERAKTRLGSKFDIREFHDQVLGAGALPLDELEARINSWIASKKLPRKKA